MIIIVMGVSGSGKTTVGRALAARLGLAFYDGDDFHPAANVEKMGRGEALDDDDRRPWLEKLAASMAGWEEQGGAVLACSALKQSYRETLMSGAQDVRFVWLKGSAETIAGRMAARRGHYMPVGLLASQFAALEPPEDAIAVSIEKGPEEIAEEVYERLKKTRKG